MEFQQVFSIYILEPFVAYSSSDHSTVKQYEYIRENLEFSSIFIVFLGSLPIFCDVLAEIPFFHLAVTL